MELRKSWGLFLVVVLVLGLVPSRGQAQIVMGTYTLMQIDDDSGQLIGKVVVQDREPSASVYVEHWSIFGSGRVLVPGTIVEISPILDEEALTVEKSGNPAPSHTWEAWSGEEMQDVSLSISELIERTATGVEDCLQVAEIIQCFRCGGDLGTGEMVPVGWVMEWTDGDGLPLGQEWWLTAGYEYPSPAMTRRTFLRTLDHGERAVSTRWSIAKRIGVDFRPALGPESADDLFETGSDGSPLDLRAVNGSCSAPGSRGGGSTLFAGASIALVAAWRRRRARRS